MSRVAPPELRWLVSPFVASGIEWAKLRYGTDLESASAEDALRHSRVPVLLIHGLDDHLTSSENSRRLAAVNPAMTSLWLAEGAGPATVGSTTRREFERRVIAWIESHP